MTRVPSGFETRGLSLAAVVARFAKSRAHKRRYLVSASRVVNCFRPTRVGQITRKEDDNERFVISFLIKEYINGDKLTVKRTVKVYSKKNV